MEQTQVNLSQRSDNKESSYYVRNNIWPKSTALPHLENSLSTSQWRHSTLEAQPLTKVKVRPQEMRDNRGSITMVEQVHICLRISLSHHIPLAHSMAQHLTKAQGLTRAQHLTQAQHLTRAQHLTGQMLLLY